MDSETINFLLFIFLCVNVYILLVGFLAELYEGGSKEDKSLLSRWFFVQLYLIGIVLGFVWLVFEVLFKLLRWAIQYPFTKHRDRVKAQRTAETLRIEKQRAAETLRIEKQRAAEIRRIGNETRQQMYKTFDDYFNQ